MNLQEILRIKSIVEPISDAPEIELCASKQIDAVVTQEKGRFYVKTRKGKILSGPHQTSGEARARLDQDEKFGLKRMVRGEGTAEGAKKAWEMRKVGKGEDNENVGKGKWKNTFVGEFHHPDGKVDNLHVSKRGSDGKPSEWTVLRPQEYGRGEVTHKSPELERSDIKHTGSWPVSASQRVRTYELSDSGKAKFGVDKLDSVKAVKETHESDSYLKTRGFKHVDDTAVGKGSSRQVYKRKDGKTIIKDRAGNINDGSYPRLNAEELPTRIARTSNYETIRKRTTSASSRKRSEKRIRREVGKITSLPLEAQQGPGAMMRGKKKMKAIGYNRRGEPTSFGMPRESKKITSVLRTIPMKGKRSKKVKAELGPIQRSQPLPKKGKGPLRRSAEYYWEGTR